MISQSLLPENLRNSQNPYLNSALTEWYLHSGTNQLPSNRSFQSEWDKPMFEYKFSSMLQSTTSKSDIARFCSVSAESSLVWLDAIPIPSLGLHLDPMTFKIACGLHLGSPLCHPHHCTVAPRLLHTPSREKRRFLNFNHLSKECLEQMIPHLKALI